MQQFARDIVAIMGEIVAEQFDEATLYNMGGLSLLPESQNPQEFQAMFSEAVQLLRDEATRSFRIDIETDSTIAITREMEKKTRVEAVAGIGRFIRDAKQLGDMSPSLLPFATELLMFATRSFKAGRNLEASLEDAMEQVQAETQKRLQQPPTPPPEVQKAQAEMQMAQQKFQQEMQRDQQKMQAEMQRKAQEVQLKSEESARELEIKRQEMEADITLKREELAAELELKREETLADIELERMKFEQDIAMQLEKQSLEAEKQRAEINSKKPKKRVAKFTTDASGDRIAVVEEIIEELSEAV
jgi:hypothetical protein